MKTKKLFKSLLSLALAVILTASVCVCGFSVAATETTDVTVNVIDGTVAAPYTGGGNHLTAKAGITGVLEGKTVARLIPQYAYDGRRQISVDARTITEGEIDYANAKTISLYIKNDLGDSIKWRMSDYADTDKATGTTYHATNFSAGTAYWMVDTVKNTAKKYIYSIVANYIYIPKDFEGYIIYDLTTCTEEMLSAFLGCNFDHIFFWMEGFNDNTIGNPFYYGDMNISTVTAETMVDTLVPTAVEEYVTTSPLTDLNSSKVALDYQPCYASYVDNDYIGQSLDFAYKSANPAVYNEIFTATADHKNVTALVFKLKLEEGASFPLIRITSNKNNSNYGYGYLKTDWVTINLLDNKVRQYIDVNTDKVSVSKEAFEGYVIAYINDETTVACTSLAEGYTSPLSWNDFIDYYTGYKVNYRFSINSTNLSETDCLINLGEVSYVYDAESFMAQVLPNEKVILDPKRDNVYDSEISGTNTNYRTVVDGGDVLGNAFKFTVSEENDKKSYLFRPTFFYGDPILLDQEALVYRVKVTNGAYTQLFFKLLGTNGYVTATYSTINTLNGMVRNYDNATSYAKIEDEEFEGYVIINLTGATISGYEDWNGLVNSRYDNFVDVCLNGSASTTEASAAGKLNNLMIGECSIVKDLDAFMAELFPAEETDTNETVISDPETNGFNDFELGNENYHSAVEVIDGGEVLGSAFKFTVDESFDKDRFYFQPVLCNADESLLDKDALVYRFKITGGAFKSFSIKMYDMWWYVTAPYTTINTLNGAVRNYDAASEIKIEDDEFEGYVILDIDNMIIKHADYEGMSWNDMINKKLAADNKRILAWFFQSASETNTVAGKLNNFLWGETSVVDNKNEFIKKVTASTLEGDANEDGKVDILDLVRMKKYIAGIKDTEINPFNVKLADDGAGLGGTDLTIVRKMLTVEGWKPVTNDIGMAIWGLSDFDAWDSKYGATYGYAEDLFNYAGAANIETMRVTDAAGSVGWIKLTDPFADNTTTEMTESALTQLDRRIEGYKKVGLWDSIVGFCSEEIRLQNNMSDEQYKIFTKYLSEKYPGKRIMAVLSIEEVIGSETFGSDRTITPANYDTYQYTTDIAYDIYTSIDKEKYQGYNETLKTNLAGLDYKMWYMPKTFWWNKAEYDTEEFMLNHLNLMYELLQEETNPGGLWCYGWNSYLDENGEGQVGLGDINTKGDYSNLLARIAEIAKEIRAKN